MLPMDERCSTFGEIAEKVKARRNDAVLRLVLETKLVMRLVRSSIFPN